MVTSEPPVCLLMGIKFFFSSWDGLDTYSLPIGQMKKKKNCVSKWRRLELGTQSSLWSSQLMPTEEIQPEIFIPWTAPRIGSSFTLHFCKQKCLRAGVHTSAYPYILTETKY